MNDRTDKTQQGEAARETSSSEYLGLPPDKAYYLQRIDVLQGLQNDLLNWGKRRFWFISIIVSILALLGVTTLITSLIEVRVNSQITKEISRYEKKLEELRDATSHARTATIDAEKSAEESRKKLREFENKTKDFANNFKDLEGRSTSLRIELADSSKDNLRITEELRAEVSRIAELIGKLSSENKTILTQAQSVEQSLNESKASIEKAAILADRKRYEIVINGFEKGDMVESELRKLGLQARFDEDGPAKEKPEDFTGILLGKSVPPDVFSSVISVVNSLLPPFQYVIIFEGDSLFNTIIIGTKPLWPGKRLLPLDQKDFDHIKSLKNTQDLHKYLAKFKKTPE